MIRWVKYSGDLSLRDLEQALNDSEAGLLTLQSLAVEQGETLAMFTTAAEPEPPLRIAFDPNGSQTPGPGERLVGRGRALIKKQPVVIVIFRPSGSKRGGSPPPKA